MDQAQLKVQGMSSLLILSNRESDFLRMRNLLCTYFPSASKDQIHLDTKYYLADVRVIRKEWPSSQQIAAAPSIEQEQQANTSPEDKQDMLIMIANQEESFPSQTYDYIISKYNPENFILIVNTKNKLMPWVDQNKISNEVNNFIEIIKEDLQLLNQNPPQRTKTGLLADTYEDGNIFNLLELIQTTPWPNITRKIFEKEKAQVKIQLRASNEAKQEQKHEQVKGEQAEPAQQELTDEQLQSEMNAFESLMGEMMNLREISSKKQAISDNDRKKRAEDIMKKLVGGWM